MEARGRTRIIRHPLLLTAKISIGEKKKIRKRIKSLKVLQLVGKGDA